MASLTCLPHKHKDICLTPNNYIKAKVGIPCFWFQTLGSRRPFLGTYWIGSLAKSASSKFNRKSVSKTKVKRHLTLISSLHACAYTCAERRRWTKRKKKRTGGEWNGLSHPHLRIQIRNSAGVSQKFCVLKSILNELILLWFLWSVQKSSHIAAN